MNRQMFRRTEGKTLRLRPEAMGPHGERLDDDWAIEIDPVREAATLTNTRTRLTVVVGFDHVHSFMSDPARGDDYGFLEMHTHVRVHRDGHITSEPMPPRAGAAPPLSLLDPFIVYDGTARRELTWRGRDEVDALPLAEDRQLMDTFRTICDALRQETGCEPQFDRYTWKQQVAALMETAGSLPSEVSRVQRLGTFTPTNLPPLVLGVAAGDQSIIARNLKHRREMAERLDRLLDAIQKLEQRAGS